MLNEGVEQVAEDHRSGGCLKVHLVGDDHDLS